MTPELITTLLAFVAGHCMTFVAGALTAIYIVKRWLPQQHIVIREIRYADTEQKPQEMEKTP